jgi:membrane protein implicated in regulation of membrane protease activity
MGILFNWALIVLTALVGGGAAATGIVHFVPNGPKWLQIVLWVVVFGLGALYQARSLRGRKAKARGR